MCDPLELGAGREESPQQVLCCGAEDETRGLDERISGIETQQKK